MNPPKMIPLPSRAAYSDAEMLERAIAFHESIQTRRTVRHFSGRPVDRRVIEQCIRAAGTAPSGANLQPWQFVLVSEPSVKRRIREAAEAEEREFYSRRAPKEWLDALAPLGTDQNKPFLEIAPYLIAVFVKKQEPLPGGKMRKNYYAIESAGIAAGFLLTALHHAGLATLTHTPSPMDFLGTILGRPTHEKPFLLIVTGHPDTNATVPDIQRKPLEEICETV